MSEDSISVVFDLGWVRLHVSLLDERKSKRGKGQVLTCSSASLV